MSEGSSNTSATQVLTAKKKAEEELKDMFSRLSLKEGIVKAPPRKAPGTAGQRHYIDTNVYQVKIDEKCAYHYHVSFTGVSLNDKRIMLTKSSENDAVIAERAKNCRDAFRAIFHVHQDFFGGDINRLYYDLQATLYTLSPLHIEKDKSHTLRVEKGQIEIPEKFKAFEMEIKNVNEDGQKIQLNDLSKLINSENLERDRSVLNVVELAVNQYPLFHENEFLTLRGSTAVMLNGTKNGLPEVFIDRNRTKYLSAGVRKSAALIEGFKKSTTDPDQRSVGLLVEAKRSPFHSTHPLLDYIKFCDVTSSLHGDFLRGYSNDEALTTLTRTFKKLQLIVNYPDGKKRKIELHTFDKSTANSHVFTVSNRNSGDSYETTVAEYFRQKFQQPLRNPNAHLVCVKQGRDENGRPRLNFYPPEFLQIADNQRVTTEQMDGTSKSNMVKACATAPNALKQESIDAAKAIHLRESQHSENAGIHFTVKPLETKARVLPPPSVTYAGRNPIRVRTDEAAWKMGNFVKPAQCNKYCIYVLMYGRNPNMTDNDIASLARAIENGARRLGTNFGQFVDSGVYQAHQVEECVAWCANNGVGLCIFVTPDNITDQHSVMKMCEHRYNVVTQDLKLKTAYKVYTGGAAATMENFLAKTNLKLGGLNHSLEVANPTVMEELKKSMFVGISTNSPGSKTIVDRAKTVKTDEKPNVLGFCANMGKNYNEFIGDFLFTPVYRPELYEQLHEVFRICVQKFKENRGYAPKSVYFYYAGLNDGQFDNALRYTIPLIKQGIFEANGSDIPLVLLGVQKINNIRLFPKEFPLNGKDHELNVPHGTVVDTTIVNPVFTEFYLMAHSALKGTGRAPRYTIVHDDGDYSLDVLEGVTHALSYQHQIVGRTTALPTPVVVAEGYAQRGRDVFNAEFHDKAKNAELPRNTDETWDLKRLSSQLNYSGTKLGNQRVNA